MSRRLLAVLCVAFVLVGSLAAEDWASWRGPRLDGTSKETGVPTEFSPTKNVVWKTTIPGTGYSSPIVVGKRVFVTSCLEDKNERVLHCLDRSTGNVLWAQTVLTAPLEKKHGLNSYASGTPTSDGEHVWVSFMGEDNSMQVACYDFAGKKIWQKSPGKLLSRHGFCSSPILHKNLVILNGDQDAKGYLVAYDKATGEEKWRTERPNRTRSYCTPILIACPVRKGVTQLVLSGSMCVAGYDADTGKELWIHDGPTEQYVASLVPHEGILFLTTGFPEFHLMGLRPDGTGNITKTDKVAWHIPHAKNKKEGAAYVPSPLANDGHFFVVSDAGYLGCIVAKTGERLWKERLGRRHSASPVLIEGNMFITDDDGKVWIVKANAKFQVIAKNDMKEEIYASPAVSEKQLFLRTASQLYCIGAK
jgi:hypothetical protein